MVAIKNISVAAALLSGAAHQALAAPLPSSAPAPEAALEARELDVEERDELDERSFGSFMKKVGHVAGGAVKMLIREEDLEGRDIDELSEREINELVERYADEMDLDARDIDERSFKSFIKKVGHVAGGAVKMLIREEDLEEREFDAELEERDFDDIELDARDIDERSFKSFIKKVGHVAGGAVKMLIREEDLQGRDISELSEREVDELVERFADEAELAARDLDERSFKSFIKKVGHVAGGAVKMLIRDTDELEERFYEEAALEGRDVDELDERSFGSFMKKVGHVAGGAVKMLIREEDLEGRDISELSEREVDELVERFADEAEIAARDLDERSFKSFIKKVGHVAGGAVKMLIRDEDIEEREFDELDERSFGSFMKKVGHVAGGAVKMLIRDEDFEERDFDEELEERDFDEELEERDFDEDELFTRYYDEYDVETRDVDELDERSFGSFMKKVGHVAGGAVKMLIRDEDLEGRDIELDERDLEYIFARYLEDEE